jgi:Flp pilus assembly pilin Flp
MPALLKRLLRDAAGATAIEYAFVAVLIAVAIAGTVATIAPKITSGLGTVASAL